MSDIIKAAESSTIAETKVEITFNTALARLHTLNMRLLALHDEIRASQPKTTGSICLEVYPCGPGCRGCPHPRWVQYKWTRPKDGSPGVMFGINLDAKKKEPISLLARKSDQYAKTSALIREAKNIIKERATLLAAVRALDRFSK